jgi:hypothetical protein
MVVYLLVNEFSKSKKCNAWFEQQSPAKMGALILVSSIHSESFNILESNFLGLEFFQASVLYPFDLSRLLPHIDLTRIRPPSILRR